MTYKTANGRNLDMQSLMMQNDREIAVGNSSTNARGDQLGPGGKVLRTKEELTKAFYTRQMGSKLTDLPSEPAQAKAPDPFQVQADLPVDQADWAPDTDVTTPLPPDLADARANALAQSQLLAERIRQQRQKEADEKNKG